MNVLGKNVDSPLKYAPQLLMPITREVGRRQLANNLCEQMKGVDIWHCYELSWSIPEGGISQYIGVITIDANSAKTVESKSLKLYLNSLNHHEFASNIEATATITKDLFNVLGTVPKIDLIKPEKLGCMTSALVGKRLTLNTKQGRVTINGEGSQANKNQYIWSGLRSLCPVTNQPDWATVLIDAGNQSLKTEHLTKVLMTVQNHQGFHEQCIEQIFCGLLSETRISNLQIAGFFQRRGGIDITPWRSNQPMNFPTFRLHRQ